MSHLHGSQRRGHTVYICVLCFAEFPLDLCFLHLEIYVMGNSYCPMRVCWVIMIFHCHFLQLKFSAGDTNGNSSCNEKLEVVDNPKQQETTKIHLAYVGYVCIYNVYIYIYIYIHIHIQVYQICI